ncbi:MAG TPA: VOC family protein [Candidatus Saccharimonadales bacterium]|nr:VOC family protein [Candidatus Saccharimonadales bacterium]
MFKPKGAFSGFSVNDLAKAKIFYTEVLGLEIEDNGMGLKITLPGGVTVFAYQKENHQPATFTILNFEVENIDEAVDALTSKGVVFERYEGMTQDDKGVMRGIAANRGPDIAWFKDPAGNILSIIKDK